MNRFYNFAGYDAIMVANYDIDDIDLHIISYLLLMQTFDKTEKVEKDGNIYVWLKYEKILEDNPSIKIQRRGLETRTSNLKKKGLIDIISKCIENSKIKKTYFRVTDEARNMMFTHCNSEVIIQEKKQPETKALALVEEENSEIVEQWELDFQKFYKAYPKKQDKQNVIKWFKKNKPSQKLMDQIMAALEKFKKTKQWQENKGQFIPMPSTWLNNKRWEDEIVAGKSELEQFLENNSGIDEVF